MAGGRRPGYSTAVGDIVERLFVYGTLRAGQPARALVAHHVVSAAPATMPGALVAFDTYPGVVLGQPGTVHGELLVLRDLAAGLAMLDAYEGAEYRRVVQPVTRGDGDVETAWVYVLADPARAAHGVPLPGGDWVAHLAGRARRG